MATMNSLPTSLQAKLAPQASQQAVVRNMTPVTLADYKPAGNRKILVYGPPKIGKTWLVGKLAEILRLHWVDGEDGIKTLMNPECLAPQFRANVNLIRVPDTQSHPILIETLLKIMKGGDVYVCFDHGVCNCPECSRNEAARWAVVNVDKFTATDALVIDSVSQVALSAMHRVTAPQIAKDIANDKADYKPDWEDYRKQGFLLDRLFTMVQAAPFNVICISHEQLVEMEDGKKKIVPIGGTSNFSKTFAKYFDEVVYCDKVNGRHVAYSSSTYSNSIITGSRAGILVEKDMTNGLKALFA